MIGSLRPLVFAAITVLVATFPRAAEGQREVLLVGSSSVSGALGRTIVDELEHWGFAARRRARGASGFARPDFYNWEAQVPLLAPFDRYAAVVVLTGGNDVQSLRDVSGRSVRWQNEAAWTEEYVERVRRFVDRLCNRGARRVIVVLPANGGRPRWSERIVRVRHGLSEGAAASQCGLAVDGGDDELPSHDGVHLTRRGAARMWARIAGSFARVLEVRRPEGDASPRPSRSALDSAGSTTSLRPTGPPRPTVSTGDLRGAPASSRNDRGRTASRAPLRP